MILNKNILDNSQTFPSNNTINNYHSKNPYQDLLLTRSEFIDQIKFIQPTSNKKYPFKNIKLPPDNPYSQNKLHLQSPNTSFSTLSITNKFTTPTFFKSTNSNSNPEFIDEWKIFFYDYLPKTKSKKFLSVWLNLAKKEILSEIETTEALSYTPIYGYAYDYLHEVNITDGPYITIWYESIYDVGENYRLYDELIYLIDFILHRIFKYEAQNVKAWLTEYNFESILNIDLPEKLNSFAILVFNIQKNFNKNSLYIDGDLEDFLHIGHSENEIDNLSLILNKAAIKEYKTYLNYVQKISSAFIDILIEPLGQIFPFFEANIYDSDLILQNKVTKEILSEEKDFEDRENVYWEIFFNYYYPDLIKTNWIKTNT